MHGDGLDELVRVETAIVKPVMTLRRTILFLLSCSIEERSDSRQTSKGKYRQQWDEENKVGDLLSQT